ncbi:MAG: hypothetical protein WB239_04495 [Acidimicrobiia bacterium]
MTAPRRRRTLIVWTLAVVLAIAGVLLVTTHRDVCPGSVFYQPAGGCIVPDRLIVVGDLQEVEAAVSVYGGWVMPSFENGDVHHVHVEMDQVELDQIKTHLEQHGFEVSYQAPYSLGSVA